jgi:hypothetical protein
VGARTEEGRREGGGGEGGHVGVRECLNVVVSVGKNGIMSRLYREN